MNSNEDMNDDIDRYLREEMSDEEKVAFERKLGNDQNLKTELKLQESINSVLARNDKTNLKAELMDIGREVDNENNPKGRSVKLYWYAAACVAIISLLVFSQLIRSERSGQEIFDSYFEQYPVEEQTRGVSKEDKEQFWQFYLEDDYQSALSILQMDRAQDPDNKQLIIYIANCHIRLNQPDKAINILREIGKQSEFYHDALWFSSFAYLQKGDDSAFEKGMSELANSNSIYTKKAAEIKSSL